MLEGILFSMCHTNQWNVNSWLIRHNQVTIRITLNHVKVRCWNQDQSKKWFFINALGFFFFSSVSDFLQFRYFFNVRRNLGGSHTCGSADGSGPRFRCEGDPWDLEALYGKSSLSGRYWEINYIWFLASFFWLWMYFESMKNMEIMSHHYLKNATHRIFQIVFRKVIAPKSILCTWAIMVLSLDL